MGHAVLLINKKNTHTHTYMQGVSGAIINILGDGSMDYYK